MQLKIIEYPCAFTGPAGPFTHDRCNWRRGGESKTYGGVNFPLGDRSFADQASLQPGDGTDVSNAAQAVGPPKGEDKYVSLSDGGVLTARFVDNILVDTDGPDLYIFEIGPKVEPFKVEISQDGSKWTNLGTVSGQPTSLDIHGKTPEGAKFSYVRITDSKSHMSSKPYAGADIAAIGAIGSETVNTLDVEVNANPAEGRPGEMIRIGLMVIYVTAKGDIESADDAVLSVSTSPPMGVAKWIQESGSVPGTYHVTFVIPSNATPGVYTITVKASKKGFLDDSGSLSLTVRGVGALDSRPLESVAGGIAGVAVGITGPFILAKAIAMIRARARIPSRPGYRPRWRRPTEIVPEPSWETIQFTHPHEEPGGTNWIDEEDPKKRQ